VHPPTGTVIQVDGREHFTSFRLATLELYPAEAVVGFDLGEHQDLCRSLAGETDGLSRGLARPRSGSLRSTVTARGHTRATALSCCRLLVSAGGRLLCDELRIEV
jgi:hypothetical protein